MRTISPAVYQFGMNATQQAAVREWLTNKGIEWGGVSLIELHDDGSSTVHQLMKDPTYGVTLDWKQQAPATHTTTLATQPSLERTP